MCLILGRYRETGGRSFCESVIIIHPDAFRQPDSSLFGWCSGLRLPRCIVLCIDKRWSFFSQFMKQHFPLRHDVSEWVAFYILFSSFAKSFSFCFMFYQVAKSVGKSLYVSVFNEESVFLVSDDSDGPKGQSKETQGTPRLMARSRPVQNLRNWRLRAEWNCSGILALCFV